MEPEKEKQQIEWQDITECIINLPQSGENLEPEFTPPPPPPEKSEATNND